VAGIVANSELASDGLLSNMVSHQGRCEDARRDVGI